MRINVITNNFKKEKIKNKDFIETILNEIFLISENDSNFIKDEKTKQIDIQLNDLDVKIIKQKNILNKSKKFEDELNEKISLLNREIDFEKSRLLELLGSEL